MAKWDVLDAGIVNVDAVQSATDTANDVLAPMIAVLEAALAVLDIVSVFTVGLPPILEVVVASAVNAIEQMILDLLQNNASLCVHINMNWNPDWKYRRKPGDPSRVTDYVNDNALPFAGTGTSGWLLDVAQAAYDETNPFRPLSDGDTAVTGVIILKGVPLDGNLQSLKALFDMFPDFGGFSRWLDIQERLNEGVSDEYRALLRLGPSALDEETEKIHRPLSERMGEAYYGQIIVDGASGSNNGRTSRFSSTDPSPFDTTQVGDTLKLPGEATYYTITAVNTFDDYVDVEPPILRTHLDTPYFIYRGGIAALVDALPTSASEFVPRAGNTPIWLSVPIASLIPVVGDLMTKLQNLVGSIRVGINATTALSQLVELIRGKIALIKATIAELTELIALAVSLLEFFDETYLVVINNDSGGVGKFVNDAIAAEDLPFFGDQGVVVGLVALVAADDPANHLLSFFELVGIQTQEFSADVTAAEQSRQDTWDEHFP